MSNSTATLIVTVQLHSEVNIDVNINMSMSTSTSEPAVLWTKVPRMTKSRVVFLQPMKDSKQKPKKRIYFKVYHISVEWRECMRS